MLALQIKSLVHFFSSQVVAPPAIPPFFRPNDTGWVTSDHSTLIVLDRIGRDNGPSLALTSQLGRAAQKASDAVKAAIYNENVVMMVVVAVGGTTVPDVLSRRL